MNDAERDRRARNMRIVMLRLDGFTMTDIGRFVGLSTETVRGVLYSYPAPLGVYVALRALRAPGLPLPPSYRSRVRVRPIGEEFQGSKVTIPVLWEIPAVWERA